MASPRASLPDHAPEVRRALVDVARVCEELGIERSRTERGKWTCPRHGGGSLSVRLGRDRTIQARCFGCDFAGDVLTLIAEARGLSVSRDFREVLAAGARIGGLWAVVAELEDRSGGRVSRVDPTPHGRRMASAAPSELTKTAGNEPLSVHTRARVGSTSERSDVQTSERPYPPEDEVRALWSACVGASTLDVVRQELEHRALDAEAVEALDVARALPEGLRLPRWASYRGDAPAARSWLDLGYRLVLPVFDALGGMRSVRAWRVVAGDGPKRLPPSGYRASALVMADATARALLEGGRWPDGADGRVVFVEGEPDFLTWATRFSDSADRVPAIMGITSGSWTGELAARIPDGARVIVRTHHDAAGDAYAARIRDTIAGRCTVLRSKGTP